MAKTERKSLPEVIDVLIARGRSENYVKETVDLLERAWAIKRVIGSERDKKTGKPEKGDPNYGLLAELDDIKNELSIRQEANELEGIRHGRLGIASNQMDGRMYLDPKALMEAGVTAEQIQKGTRVGESYYTTTLFEIKPKS